MNMLHNEKNIIRLIRSVEKPGSDSRIKNFNTALRLANYYAKRNKAR